MILILAILFCFAAQAQTNAPTPVASTNHVVLHTNGVPPRSTNPPVVVSYAYPQPLQFCTVQFSPDLIWWRDVASYRLDGKSHTNAIETNRVGNYRQIFAPWYPTNLVAITNP